MINQRNIIWLVPLLFIITFPAWRLPLAAFLTPRGGYDPAYANIKKDVHNFTMDKVKIQQIHNGKKSAEIRAENARTADKPDEYILTKVNTNVFDKEGNLTNIIADKGIYNAISRQLTLMENVIVQKTKDKQTLYTELLYYDDEKRTVKCPGNTRLAAEEAEIRGGSLDYDIETNKYEIGGRVHCLLEGFSEP
ncbi:MAG: LPS export ABC transporter periplasmic protein LptC [Desulfoprunum sp.]|nr:LPS export ABC transporter periplasmic protein LptC [Desulfoprunum sp.]